jgi:hypothetical protein
MTVQTMEKMDSMQVTGHSTPTTEGSSMEPKRENPEAFMTSNMEGGDEPVPHLHAKTFLVVFAVCLVYFAQLINLVGAGAVCITRSSYITFN